MRRSRAGDNRAAADNNTRRAHRGPRPQADNRDTRPDKGARQKPHRYFQFFAKFNYFFDLQKNNSNENEEEVEL